MSVIDFIIPVTYVAEDNDTYINKDQVLIKDCSGIINENSECDGYNFNRCPNDDAYCQPFEKGDEIFFQFPLDTRKHKTIFASIIDTSTGEEIEVDIETQKDTDEDRNTYFNVVVNTNQAIFDTVTCWYLKLKLYGCVLSGNVYNTCLAEKQSGGMTLLEAQKECYSEMCAISDQITSEPYCITRCNESTLLIEAYYPKWDCDNYYYGPFPTIPPTRNMYRLKVRVRGTLESNGFLLEEVVNSTKKVKGKQSERFLLRLEGIPYYVARQLARCLNAESFTIDGETYTGALKLDKDFEEGLTWYIKENVFKDCPEINYSCE